MFIEVSRTFQEIMGVLELRLHMGVSENRGP